MKWIGFHDHPFASDTALPATSIAQIFYNGSGENLFCSHVQDYIYAQHLPLRISKEQGLLLLWITTITMSWSNKFGLCTVKILIT